MEKRIITLLFLFGIILFLPFVISEDLNITSKDVGSVASKAKTCIDNWIDEYDCDDLSTEEKIFVAFGTNKCKSELKEDSDNNECWPDKGGCEITTTAKAIIALDSSGSSVSNAEDWLLDQAEEPSDLEWYLQIESSERTTCEIEYDGKDYDVVIGEDKKLNSNAGSCLSRSSGDWWLRVSPSCFDEEFKISCDQQFLTNLLFKKTGSQTIFVMDETHSASAEGTTYEKVESKCLEDDGKCDYEGTLWGAIALKQVGENYSEYIPYLMAGESENQRLIPEAFLYMLTGYESYRNDLLLKQKSEQYWEEGTDKFYDTAVALLPFQNEEPAEKANTKEWLTEIQGEDGCWRGNIKNTAFLLKSVFGKAYTPTTTTDDSCIGNGYYCMSQIDCNGTILDQYSCSGTQICCSQEKQLDTCAFQGGIICQSGEQCIQGTVLPASDTSFGESCCIEGVCQEPTQTVSTCEAAGGNCRSFCLDDEEETFTYDCSSASQSCCMKKESGSLWWLWVLLLILLILIVLGIIFREKLKPYYYKYKGKALTYWNKLTKKKTSAKPSKTETYYPQRQLPRRILPQTKPPIGQPQIKGKKQTPEMEEVLKKLKEIGK